MDSIQDNEGDFLSQLAFRRFGLPSLKPLQRFVMANILEAIEEGRLFRQIVIFPTGFGKSLCFQLPALVLSGLTIVVYPLLALMADQARSLGQAGIDFVLLRGGQSPEERLQAQKTLESGRAKLVITNPETLIQPRMLEMLGKSQVQHLAIDEAHCVVEWGETFRPAYKELGKAAASLSPAVISAFTATASPSILSSIAVSLFGDEVYHTVESSPDRPNISYSVQKTLNRNHSLVRLTKSLQRPLIIFSNSRERVAGLSRLLRQRMQESEIRYYHAGLEKAEKKTIEAWFFASERGILVSTCAYGLGLDKADIRSVLHFDCPPSIEAYLQETGRAGRDGLPAQAVLLMGPGTASKLYRDGKTQTKSRFASMQGYASSNSGCRREQLMDMIGLDSEFRAPCSGCDRCEGRSAEKAEGEEEILAFIRKNSRRFTEEEVVDLLRGKALGQGVSSLARAAHWGCMKDWEELDAARAVEEAIGRGLVRKLQFWPWQGRLAAIGARKSLKAGDTLPGPEDHSSGLS